MSIPGGCTFLAISRWPLKASQHNFPVGPQAYRMGTTEAFKGCLCISCASHSAIDNRQQPQSWYLYTIYLYYIPLKQYRVSTYLDWPEMSTETSIGPRNRTRLICALETWILHSMKQPSDQPRLLADTLGVCSPRGNRTEAAPYVIVRCPSRESPLCCIPPHHTGPSRDPLTSLLNHNPVVVTDRSAPRTRTIALISTAFFGASPSLVPQHRFSLFIKCPLHRLTR